MVFPFAAVMASTRPSRRYHARPTARIGPKAPAAGGGVPSGEAQVHARLASGGQGDRVLDVDTDTDSTFTSTHHAWLGLPTGTGVYGLSDYADIVWVFNQRCSLEADGVNHARYNYVYTVAEPGATGSARTFISYGDYTV